MRSQPAAGVLRCRRHGCGGRRSKPRSRTASGVLRLSLKRPASGEAEPSPSSQHCAHPPRADQRGASGDGRSAEAERSKSAIDL